jgi:diadenosine hexaphosphate hydrolase (ATP-forming)
MSKASNRNNFLKQRLAKLQKRMHATPANSQTRNAQHRDAPSYALAEDLEVSDARGNARDKGKKFRDDRPAISEMVREATAGGVIYRITKKGILEILLVADHFDRWTIPKGHIEEGETAQETAIREIGEEAGVHELEPICWLGKIHFRYRRGNTLVLMSTQIYLFRALGDTNKIQKEDWMNGIKWFKFDEAVDVIAYEDIAKLMLMGRSRLRSRGEIE